MAYIQRFWLLSLLILLLFPLRGWAEPSTGVSILNPAPSFKKESSLPIDIIDPSPATNPSHANTPGYRGENQLVIYTSAFGASTHTSAFGREAIVEDNVVQALGVGDSIIPANGFVVSAHGNAVPWVRKFLKPGAIAYIEPGNKRLIVQTTPAVYLYDVDNALQRAAVPSDVPSSQYAGYLQQAKACRAELASQSGGEASPALAALTETCLKQANLAYYYSLQKAPEGVRGAWVRPSSIKPDEIRKIIMQLKASRITDIFLETYYQGKTIYPSQVMRAYGLPEAHSQYKGEDTLRLWTDAAHQEGIKVHAWVQVFFAGNERENAEKYGPILQKYPQWRNVQRPYWNTLTPVISNVEPGHYFLDPANAEVREFLQKLILEITQYPVDGLNLDYIRYPASTPVGRANHLATTWGYTDTARQQFKALIEKERKDAETRKLDDLKKQGQPLPRPAAIAAAKPPSYDPKDLLLTDALWPRWVEWRKQQVSSFVKAVADQVHTARPELLVSAVVFPHNDPNFAQKLQDYPRWAREGSIQALTPIGLSPDLDLMARQNAEFKKLVEDRIPVYIGIFGMYNRNTPVELVSQMDTVYRSGLPGVVLFEWSHVTPEYQEALLNGPFRE